MKVRTSSGVANSPLRNTTSIDLMLITLFGDLTLETSGTWAPGNFPARYTGGTDWLNVMLNPLEISSKLDHNVKIMNESPLISAECADENELIQEGGTGCIVSCTGVSHVVWY